MVRARRHGNDVLAVAVDENQRDARHIRHDRQLGEIDILRGERRPGFLPQWVVADRSDEGDACANPSGRNGLVAPLATGMPLERRATHGLAGDRQSIDPGNEIDIHRADDDDPMARSGARFHAHSVRLWTTGPRPLTTLSIGLPETARSTFVATSRKTRARDWLVADAA